MADPDPDGAQTSEMPERGGAALTTGLTTLAMLAFAGNSLLCRLALAHANMDPATFTVIRLGAGALVLWLLCRTSRSRRTTGSWGSAVALLAYAACFSFAYVSLTAATGALLLFGAVQATMIVSGLLAGERLRVVQWCGFGIAVVSLLALLAPGVAAPDLLGACLMLAAGAAWGAYSLAGRGATDPLAMTAGNFTRAALMALPLMMLAGGSWTTQGVVFAVLSGALASGVGYAIWYRALSDLTAARAATVQLSVPIIAALGGVAILGEAFTTRLLVASLAMLLGIGLVMQGRFARR